MEENKDLLITILTYAAHCYEHLRDNVDIHFTMCFYAATRAINELQYLDQITDEEWAWLHNNIAKEYINLMRGK